MVPCEMERSGMVRYGEERQLRHGKVWFERSGEVRRGMAVWAWRHMVRSVERDGVWYGSYGKN